MGHFDIQTLSQKLSASATVFETEDEISRHAHDWWPMNSPWKHQNKSPHRPEYVAYAGQEEDVVEILKWASEASVPVTAWGLASSVVGGPLATQGGIVLDMTRMNRVIAVDIENMHVTVQAGVNGGELEKALSAQGLTLNHSPQSLYRSTVGGWLATCATGQLSSRYGGIEDLCVGFRAVLADGTSIRVGGAPRMAVGPDLRHMIIGSEGCLAVITEVTLRIFPTVQKQVLETVRFDDVTSGVAAMRSIMLNGLRPSVLRFYDTAEARHAMKDGSYKSPVMFLASEGTEAMADVEMQELVRVCDEHGGQATGPAGAEGWMSRRYDFSTIVNRLKERGGVAETIEIANTWSGIRATYDAVTQAMAPHAEEVLGHFSHAYTDGVSLYVILLGWADGPEEAEERMAQIWEDAMRATLDTGAVLSHHHGTGLARSGFVREALGEAWPLYDRLKGCLDPKGILNPGKLGH